MREKARISRTKKSGTPMRNATHLRESRRASRIVAIAMRPQRALQSSAPNRLGVAACCARSAKAGGAVGLCLDGTDGADGELGMEPFVVDSVDATSAARTISRCEAEYLGVHVVRVKSAWFDVWRTET